MPAQIAAEEILFEEHLFGFTQELERLSILSPQFSMDSIA